MRVLLLGPYPPPHGGVQTHLVAIREYLAARGDQCEVVNITGAPATGAPGVHHPRSAAAVVRLLATLRYDIVHLHVGGTLPTRVLALAGVCAGVPGAKSVFTFHSGGYPSSPAGQTARPATLRGAVLRSFDRVIGVNAELVQLFRRFGVPADRTRLIEPHAVPALAGDALAAPAAGDGVAARLAAFFEAHDPVLLSVGLLEPEYDLPLQIEALAGVRERHPRAGLAMIGSGSLEPELRARIAGVSYADHVLLAGDVPHAATLRAIERCDVLLRTTLYDGDAISVREALHFGTPVIATDNGMRPPGVHLMPPRDAAALVRAVDACGAAPRERHAAQPTAANDNMAALYAVYEELAAAR